MFILASVKKLSFGFLVTIILILPAFSQEGFRLVLRGGPQGTAFTGNDFRSSHPREIDINKEPFTGFQFGFDFEYYFTERVGVATGLIFSRQGQTYSLDFDDTWGSYALDIRLMYAQIPFALLYRLIQTSKTNVYLRTGFYAGYRSDADDNYSAVIPEEILLPGPEDRYSSRDLGFLAGMGAEISLSKMLNLRISIEAARGLRNVYRYEPWGYLAGAASAKNTTVSLSIGLVYLHGSCCGGN